MDIHIIDAVLLKNADGGLFWTLGAELTHDDGTVTKHGYGINHAAFLIRAAEYGIVDPAEVLETLLYEPHLREHETAQLAGTFNRETLRSVIAGRRNGGKITGQAAPRSEHTPRISGDSPWPGLEIVTDVGALDTDPVDYLKRTIPENPHLSGALLLAQMSGPSAGVAHVDGVPGAVKD